MKKLLTLALALAALIAAGAPAESQQYPPAPLFINVSNLSPAPGDEIVVETGTYDPESTVTLTLWSESVVLGAAIAGADGVATLSVTVPGDTAPGRHSLTATGTHGDGSPVSVSTAITVTEPGAAAAATGLPRTGDDSVPFGRIGAALFAVGAGLLIITRRRRLSVAV